jgi:hypothetical protein
MEAKLMEDATTLILHMVTASKDFSWNQMKMDSMLEFVAEIANKHNLSLVDLTVFPMSVNHKSLTVQTSVCNMWSTYLDKVNQKESNPISQGSLRMCNRIISEYFNGVNALESHALRPSKKARLGKGSLVPKSVFIESSIDSSIDNMSSFNDSFNDSIKELMEFGQRTL